MFPYNEEEWLFISAKKTLEGEITWLNKQRKLFSIPRIKLKTLWKTLRLKVWHYS
jgi:hypothetical protein